MGGMAENALQRTIAKRNYPCVAARTALAKNQIEFFIATDLRCPAQDADILNKIYEFIARYIKKKTLYSSLVVSFPATPEQEEIAFEGAMWRRLQGLHELDRTHYAWDKKVSSDPASSNFGLSLGGQAFFVVGLHPRASRPARRFESAALVFNLHDQFERLKETGKFAGLQRAIRERDERFSGSVNPMLADYGDASEALQYSGRNVEKKWKCPFHPVN